MKKSLLIIVALVFLSNGFVFAKSIASGNKNITDKEHDGFLQLSSLNVEVMQFGIKRPGLGFSYDFERYLGFHLALSGVLGASGFFGDWFSFEDFVTTSSAGANFRYYPFHDSLHGFYVGSGAGCDAMFYFGNKELPEDVQRIFGYVKPEIGWKFYLLKHFMIDVNLNYKWQSILDKDSLPDYYLSYMDNGFHFGLAFKFFWAK